MAPKMVANSDSEPTDPKPKRKRAAESSSAARCGVDPAGRCRRRVESSSLLGQSREADTEAIRGLVSNVQANDQGGHVLDDPRV